MRPGRGPDLPYSVVAGVTPCPDGWLVASAKLRGLTFAPEHPRIVAEFVDVLDERPSFEVVALNAPIGRPDELPACGRTCDREALALLGRRASSMQGAPSRASGEGLPERPEDRLDAVCDRLLARYREVTTEMAPYRQRTVYEVLPELTFFHLNGDAPLGWSKHLDAGRAERRSLLQAKVPELGRILGAELGEPQDRLLEAAACLWTARRIAARAAIRLPADPEWDDRGLRMEIVR